MCHHIFNKKRVSNKEIESNYLGPQYTNNEILKIIKINKLKFKKINNIEKLIAKEIEKGKIIGHFSGSGIWS